MKTLKIRVICVIRDNPRFRQESIITQEGNHNPEKSSNPVNLASDRRRNMPHLNIKPSYKSIKTYYAEFQEHDTIGVAHVD